MKLSPVWHDVLVPAIRDGSPQARRSFTVADQVNQLVGASEADPELGFMARLMALCSLPRTNPGNQHQYKRKNGPFELVMIAGADNKLPFGNFPRLHGRAARSCQWLQRQDGGDAGGTAEAEDPPR